MNAEVLYQSRKYYDHARQKVWLKAAAIIKASWRSSGKGQGRRISRSYCKLI
jgi:hypothetical protein